MHFSTLFTFALATAGAVSASVTFDAVPSKPRSASLARRATPTCAAGQSLCPENDCCPTGDACCTDLTCCCPGLICCNDGFCCPSGTTCEAGGKCSVA